MLLPSNFRRLHENLHSFRTNALPLLLSELKEKSISFSCCEDYIMWQCIIDEILQNELKVSKGGMTGMSLSPQLLSHVEQNAVRYTAGFVI